MDNKEKQNECTPGNCPFAVDNNPNSPHRAWGMSPEGWEQARIRHQDHCKRNICPSCGKSL